MKKVLNYLLLVSILLLTSLSLAQNWRQSRQGRMQHYGNYSQSYNSYNYPCNNYNTLGVQPLHMHYNPYVDPNYYRPSPYTYPNLEYFGPNVLIFDGFGDWQE